MSALSLVAFGITSHLLFAIGVGAMAIQLYNGLATPLVALPNWSLLVDLFLLTSFPILHSYFLGKRGRALLIRIFPTPYGRRLLTTTFAFFASLQTASTFLLWQPLGPLFEFSGVLLKLSQIAYAASWLALIVSIYEAGVGLQTGFIGWHSSFKHIEPRYPPLPTQGLHGLCRHPIYQSFLLILVTGPVWSVDHILIAIVWGLYCVIGPRFKENRLQTTFGGVYNNYQQKVPYFYVPFFPRTLS